MLLIGQKESPDPRCIGPWSAICIHSAGGGSDLYQLRGNLNCQIESAHGMSYCVAQLSCPLAKGHQGKLGAASQPQPAAAGSASLASEKCRTTRRRDGNNGNLTRGQPGTIPTHCAFALSSDTIGRSRGIIPGGRALPYTLTRHRRSPKREPRNNTGFWPLGSCDDRRDS